MTSISNQFDVTGPEQREKLGLALNEALKIFAVHADEAFDDVLSSALKPLADVMAVDRIVFYRCTKIEGNNRLEQIFLWNQVIGGLTDRSLDLLPGNSVVDHWLKLAMQDVCVNAHLGNLDKDGIDFLNTFGIKSLLVIPIFTQGKFWGVVIFQDHHNKRYFDETCMDLYRSAAYLSVSAIIRAEMTQKANEVLSSLKNRETMMEILVKTAIVFFSRSENLADDMMTAGVGMVADMLKIDRISVWKNTGQSSDVHASQLFRWDRKAGGTTPPLPRFQNVALSRLVPSLEMTFSHGDAVNCPVSLLPNDSLLKSSDIKSLFLSPIFANNTLWGFVFFADSYSECSFDDVNAEMMRSAAFMIADTVIRTEMAREIAEKNEFNRTVFETAPIGVTMFDEHCTLFECNEAVLKMLNTDKQSFIEHFFKFAPEYQPNGRNSKEMAVDFMKQALEGKMAHSEWTHCFPNTGEMIPCDVTLARAKFKGKFVGLAYIYDLRRIKEIEKQLETAIDRTYVDPLTDIYNRRYFDENLTRILKSLSRSGGILSLMMIDIDCFKKYNDTYGHIEGDKCLKTIAKTLNETVMRADDFVARYGGEEFVVVLPNTDENGARIVAEKLCKKIRECNIPHISSDVEKHVTISLGSTTSMVTHSQKGSEYIQRADEMLYHSKQCGRNRSSFAPVSVD